MKQKAFVLVFFLLIFNSPWFLTILTNKSFIFPYKPEVNSNEAQIILDNANTLRGETVNVVHPLVSKVFANKYVFLTRDRLSWYFNSFSPHMLFFSSPEDPKQYPQNSGLLYLSLLPLIVLGVKKLKKIESLVLLISPVLPLIYLKIDIVLLVPTLLMLTYLSSKGFLYLVQKKHFVLPFIILSLLFEIVKYHHNFWIH